MLSGRLIAESIVEKRISECRATEREGGGVAFPPEPPGEKGLLERQAKFCMSGGPTGGPGGQTPPPPVYMLKYALI
jgi:hypothetical protein